MRNINNISELLYVERVSKRITQAEAAKRSGCSMAMISCIESGKRTPSVEVVVKIAKGLGVKQEVLCAVAAKDLKNDIEKLWDK